MINLISKIFIIKLEIPIFAGLCEILGKFSNNIPFHEFYTGAWYIKSNALCCK